VGDRVTWIEGSWNVKDTTLLIPIKIKIKHRSSYLGRLAARRPQTQKSQLQEMSAELRTENTLMLLTVLTQTLSTFMLDNSEQIIYLGTILILVMVTLFHGYHQYQVGLRSMSSRHYVFSTNHLAPQRRKVVLQLLLCTILPILCQVLGPFCLVLKALCDMLCMTAQAYQSNKTT